MGGGGKRGIIRNFGGRVCSFPLTRVLSNHITFWIVFTRVNYHFPRSDYPLV